MASFEAALEQEAPKASQKIRSHQKKLVEQPWWILLQIIAIVVLLDTERLQLQKPFGMDLLHFYPLRGSLGRKPGRATQAKVRAKKKKEKEQKKKRKKVHKKKENQKKEMKWKEMKRKEMKRIEKKRKTKLARSKTRNGRLGKS